MQFILDIKSGSFIHRMGRARNRPAVKLAGMTFQWDGERHCYSAGLRKEVPEDLFNHPAVRVMGMGNMPAIMPSSEAEMWAAEEAAEAKVKKAPPGRPKKMPSPTPPPPPAKET
jgi:hypothetical protein